MKKTLSMVLLLIMVCLLPLNALAIRYGDVVYISNSNAVNVRRGPGTRYSSIGQAPSGSTWDYAGMEDGWNMIWYGEGQIGYIAANRTEVEVWNTTEATSGATEEEDTSSGSNWEGAWPIFRHECEWCDGKGTNKWGNKCAFCDGNGWK